MSDRVPGLPRDAGSTLDLEVSHEDSELVVLLAGDLDLATADVARQLVAAIPELATDRVCLDLAEVTFLDSSGLQALLAVRQACEDTGVKLVLRAPPVCVRKVLEVSHTDVMFLIEG